MWEILIYMAGFLKGIRFVCGFGYTSKVCTSDELGIFLKNFLRENDCDPELIRQIAACSVVPQLDYSLAFSLC